jgi:integrase
MTKKRSKYGQGFVSRERGRYRAFVPDGKGGRKTVGIFDDEATAYRVKNAALLLRADAALGTTLRQWGEAYLQSISAHKSIRSTTFTWNSVICSAPFIDDPLDLITPPMVNDWAETGLIQQRKRRSVLRAGKRSLIELDETISRKYAQNALGILSLAFDAAIRRGLITENPAALARVPVDRTVAIDDALTYLSTDEVDRLLDCPSMPLEQRVVFTLATHQAPREGELAGMDWERIDWEGHGWYIAQSWDGTTKNRKTRWQALIPRAERVLREWHVAQGQPKSGVVFPTPRPNAGGKTKRYARGHDWGFADHPERHITRLGWWRRAGIRTRVRFHDLRDTAATHLLSGSWGPAWSMEQVSKHLGHSSVKVTEARYAHLTRDAKRKAAASIESEKPSANSPQPPTTAQHKNTEKRRGSGSWTRTNDQSVNSPQLAQQYQQLTQIADGLRTVWHPEAVVAARELMERVASGDPAKAEVEALALAVLEQPAVALALSLLSDRKSLPIPRALELARLILEGDTVAAAARDQEKSS